MRRWMRLFSNLFRTKRTGQKKIGLLRINTEKRTAASPGVTRRRGFLVEILLIIHDDGAFDIVACKPQE